MKTFNFQLTDDLTVPIQANSREEAERILKSEIIKKEASPIFDKEYFDYETGINIPGLRAKLARQEKMTEKENVLRAAVTKDGFNMTTKGDLAITPEGQQILIDQGLLDWEKPMSKSVVIDENKFGSAGDYADFAGAIGPVFGAIAALTPQFKVLKGLSYLFKTPMLRNAIASGVGSAAGKGAEEALDNIQGFYDKDAGELGDLLKFEAGVGFAGQGLGEFVGKAFGAVLGRKAPTETIRDGWIMANRYSLDDVLKLDASLGRTATQKEIKQAWKNKKVERFDIGAVISQNALKRAIPGRMQAAGETIFGKTGRENSIIAYNKSLLSQLKRSVAEKRAKLKELSEFDGADSKTIAEVRAKRKELDMAEEDITRQIEGLVKDLAEESGGFRSTQAIVGKGELGENIQDTIAKAYTAMQEGFETTYDDLFARVRKIDPKFRVNLSDVSNYIEEIVELNSGYFDVDGPVGKVLAHMRQEIPQRLEREGGHTFTQLINMRARLKGKILIMGEGGGKQTNIPEEVVKILDEKIKNLGDSALTSAIRIGKQQGKPLTKKQSEKINRIREQLNTANANYYKQHKPFDSALVQKLKNSEAVDPSQVYDAIFGKGKGIGKVTAIDLKALVNAIPLEKRGAIFQSFMRRYIKETSESSINDPISRSINIAAFANKVLKDKDTLTYILGNKSTEFFSTIDNFVTLKPKLTATEMAEIANQFKGKVANIQSMSPDDISLSTGRFLEALETRAIKSAEQESMKAANIFSRIENASPEEIAKVVFRPKSADDILRVKKIVSEDAFLEIREQALEQILRDSVQTGSKKLNEIFKPNNLDRALKMYDTESLNAMFGKEMTQSLQNFSRAMRTNVAEEGGGGAGGLIAGMLAINIFNVALWPTIAGMAFYKALFSNPRMVSLLTKTDKTSVGEVLRFTERFARLNGVREIALQTTKGIEQTKAGIQDIVSEAEQSEQGQASKSAFDEIISSISGAAQNAKQQVQQRNLGASNFSMDIPKVQSIAPSAPRRMSPSLIGNNPANMDIAQQGIASLV
jgi:hypothetical protein